jgi:hypothetical protein
LIKIKEDGKGIDEGKTAGKGKVVVTLEDNEEKTFEGYPIAIKSKNIKHLIYEIQKSTKTKTHHAEKGGGIMDKVIGKTKDVKDRVVDTTKDVAENTKDTAAAAAAGQQPPSGQQVTNEELGTGPEVGRMDDPLISRK